MEVAEIQERAMAGTCTVDAALFDDLKQAIDFVAERGGGVVYSELADTQYAKSLTLPEKVEIKSRRIAEDTAEATEQAA